MRYISGFNVPRMWHDLCLCRSPPGPPSQNAQRDTYPLLQTVQHGLQASHGTHQPLEDWSATRQGSGRGQAIGLRYLRLLQYHQRV